MVKNKHSVLSELLGGGRDVVREKIGWEEGESMWTSIGKASTVLGIFFFAVYLNKLTSNSVNVEVSNVTNKAPTVMGVSDSQINQNTNTYTYNFTEAVIETCEYYACEDFTDLTGWTTHPNLQVVSISPTQIYAKVDEKQRGGVMYFDQKFLPPDFNAIFKVTPMGLTQSNIFLEYKDQFKYIIGDAGYNRIAVKTSSGYLAPENYKSKHFSLPEQIKPASTVKLWMSVSTTAGPNSLVLSFSITYTGISGKEYKDQEVPNFIIPTLDTVWKIRSPIGLGLLDWQNTGDIYAELHSLVIQPELSK